MNGDSSWEFDGNFRVLNLCYDVPCMGWDLFFQQIFSKFKDCTIGATLSRMLISHQELNKACYLFCPEGLSNRLTSEDSAGFGARIWDWRPRNRHQWIGSHRPMWLFWEAGMWPWRQSIPRKMLILAQNLDFSVISPDLQPSPKSLVRCGLWAGNRNVELWNGLFWQIRVE